ncbi:hypothetical protein [Saccharothrix obliqua]|uniref:hypothetical protein n=1 Tax=Saccharothrix obliqua TaxID=2861747 RepID=UPI001C5D74AC|nr:hypothetical protein [Saccharothrix obliqua]MBW4719070.1 hypothetical protein [Saccharothrix obliqua]
MIENSSAGLVVLQAETPVTVTGEENHQPELARYPVAPGMTRHVVVELAWCEIKSGKYQGERAIEVRLDGARVGELTHLMSRRYAPLLVQLAARGSRAGCEALLQAGVRGTEVVLRLPREGNLTLPLTPAPATPLTPAPAVPPRKSRQPIWIAAAAVGAVLLIATIANSTTPRPTANTAPTTPLSTTTAAPTTTTTAAPTTTTPSPTTTTQPPAAPPPVTQPPVIAPPEPAPAPVEPPPVPQSPCHPNYGGCVPIASDVDCAGGKGNGPEYVQGPIDVLGPDVYDLDNDHNGVACERN